MLDTACVQLNDRRIICHWGRRSMILPLGVDAINSDVSNIDLFLKYLSQQQTKEKWEKLWKRGHIRQ